MEPMSPIGEDEKSAPPAPAVDVETGLTGGDDVPPRGDVGPAPRPRLAAIQASSGPSLKNVLSSSGPSLKNVLSRPLTRRASIHDTTTFDDLRRSLSSGTTGASTNFRSVRNAGGKSDDDVDVHSRMLSLAIENACHSAYGIIGVDVWIYDEDDGSFHHAPGGYHRHYLYEPEGFKEQMALRRIEDETLANYVPPTKQVPGAGLAGYFWSQCDAQDSSITWRDVKAITDDPDQPPYLRMTLLEQAGYGKACGVPFDLRGHRGVVLYFARATADESMLTEYTNDLHLRVSADLIGGISASFITSRASTVVKGARVAKIIKRVRAKMTVILVFAKWFNDESRVEPSGEWNGSGIKMGKNSNMTYRQRVSSRVSAELRSYREKAVDMDCTGALKRRGRKLVEKSKGGNVQPPPPMPWIQAAWVFVGAFATLLLLSGVSSLLKQSIGYAIILGPFGALMTLQYGLTPAPASQPRNALYGQAIAISIALIVNLFFPSSWVRVPFTTALAIATMCKMGITHPPAGAAAAIFASNDNFDGVFFGLMLLGNVIAISTAIFINNLNDKKQYPMYYKFVSDKTKGRIGDAVDRMLPHLKRKRLEKEKEKIDSSLRGTFAEFNMQKSFRQQKSNK